MKWYIKLKLLEMKTKQKNDKVNNKCISPNERVNKWKQKFKKNTMKIVKFITKHNNKKSKPHKHIFINHFLWKLKMQKNSKEKNK